MAGTDVICGQISTYSSLLRANTRSPKSDVLSNYPMTLAHSPKRATEQSIVDHFMLKISSNAEIVSLTVHYLDMASHWKTTCRDWGALNINYVATHMICHLLVPISDLCYALNMSTGVVCSWLISLRNPFIAASLDYCRPFRPHLLIFLPICFVKANVIGQVWDCSHTRSWNDPLNVSSI